MWVLDHSLMHLRLLAHISFDLVTSRYSPKLEGQRSRIMEDPISDYDKSGVGGGDLSYTSYYFRYADKPYQKDVTCSNSQLFFHLKNAVKSN